MRNCNVPHSCCSHSTLSLLLPSSSSRQGGRFEQRALHWHTCNTISSCTLIFDSKAVLLPANMFLQTNRHFNSTKLTLSYICETNNALATQSRLLLSISAQISPNLSQFEPRSSKSNCRLIHFSGVSVCQMSETSKNPLVLYFFHKNLQYCIF